ncbi:hypothetical protein VKT23_020382 [Stygiomarasmius scandens]|uniref:Uncharacterized protein n=1 Tax=Marasmiellus scandens TaxID=2682957 RepID=A0ABR1IJ57_9AGAR
MACQLGIDQALALVSSQPPLVALYISLFLRRWGIRYQKHQLNEMSIRNPAPTASTPGEPSLNAIPLAAKPPVQKGYHSFFITLVKRTHTKEYAAYPIHPLIS